MDLGLNAVKSTDKVSIQPKTIADSKSDLIEKNNSHRIWAEIDLDALEENLKVVKKTIGGKKILLAIKADAYGHGAKEIAAQLAGKIDMFGVAGIEEGISLRTNSLIQTPILILSPIPYSAIDTLFDHNLTPTITENEFARQLSLAARKKGKPIKVHIEIDTGMGRTGLPLEEAVETIRQINQDDFLKLEGVFTHFPAADIDFPFTNKQIEKYKSLLESLANNGINNIIRHIANSAGILNFPDSYFDMIRPGLIVYGIHPWVNKNHTITLKPVMSLRTKVVNLRNIPKGNSISYERTYYTKRDSIIAVVTAGYGDGYPWALSNNGKAIVSGRKVPIVGNVCMDLTMLDVTDIPKVNIGDTVTLIGNSGNEIISVNDLAKWAKTIPYEIITRISPRVPRVFIQQGKIQRIRDLLHL